MEDQSDFYEQFLNHPWVNSALATLSTDEEIAQSVLITAGSDQDISQYEEKLNDLKIFISSIDNQAFHHINPEKMNGHFRIAI